MSSYTLGYFLGASVFSIVPAIIVYSITKGKFGRNKSIVFGGLTFITVLLLRIFLI